MTIIITGNPVDGFRYIGPFTSSEDACDWADHVDLEPDWWVSTISDPEATDRHGVPS